MAQGARLDPETLRAILERDVVAGAVRLLGCTLVFPGGRATIVETEAYRGSDDPGCHAFGRARMKNMALFGRPGTAYVYRSYGIHQMLNVVALPPGQAGGVLIRALKPSDTHVPSRRLPASVRMDGPGKLARILGVDESVNGHDLLDPGSILWISPGPEVPHVLVGPRIGLSPGKGETTPWRFVSGEDVAWISAARRGLRPYFGGAEIPYCR